VPSFVKKQLYLSRNRRRRSCRTSTRAHFRLAYTIHAKALGVEPLFEFTALNQRSFLGRSVDFCSESEKKDPTLEHELLSCVIRGYFLCVASAITFTIAASWLSGWHYLVAS